MGNPIKNDFMPKNLKIQKVQQTEERPITIIEEGGL